MISISKEKVFNILKTHNTEVDESNIKSLENLMRFRKENSLNDECQKFLNSIIKEFSSLNFITLDNSKFIEIVEKIGIVPKVKKKFHNKSKESYFKDELLRILNYKGLRGSFFPKCFSELGIKACVYCNSQLTLNIEDNRGVISAKYQLDHYYPKDKYPYLSISLFNLYPVCASCNLSKSSNELNFELYDDKLSNNFSFKLDKDSLVKFLTTRNKIDLKIEFKGDKDFESMFSINALYSTQYDIAEEMIIKNQIYNKIYRKQLRDVFSRNSISDSLINRFILGNYVETDEIHKRPMSKYMQDIGKDIGLI